MGYIQSTPIRPFLKNMSNQEKPARPIKLFVFFYSSPTHRTLRHFLLTTQYYCSSFGLFCSYCSLCLCPGGGQRLCHVRPRNVLRLSGLTLKAFSCRAVLPTSRSFRTGWEEVNKSLKHRHQGLTGLRGMGTIWF